MDEPVMAASATAQQVIEHFGLEAHPEGGWYRQTFADGDDAGGRAGPRALRSTAIYYLLAAGERSHWHRVRHAAEVWHHYAGDALRLRVSADGASVTEHLLGSALTNGEEPQLVVPADHWQSAEPLGEWTLAGCTVAPGFDFEQFELAPPGWEPGG